MRRAMLLAVCAVVLGACQTALSTNRAVPGDTVTVTPAYESPDHRCIEGTTVEVHTERADALPDFSDPAELAGLGDPALLRSGPVAADGLFEVEITAPSVLAEYLVWAECTVLVPNLNAEEGEPTEVEEHHVLDPASLIVHAPLVLSATPAEVEPGETVTISGPWCVSQLPEGETPVVSVSFADETHVLETDDPQPFDDVWELELTAPDEEGTYAVTATCSYDDGVEEEVPEEEEEEEGPVGEDGPIGEEGVGGEQELSPAAIQTAEYAPVDVVVAAQPTTTTTEATTSTTEATTSTTAPAAGPRAVVAQPTYTG